MIPRVLFRRMIYEGNVNPHMRKELLMALSWLMLIILGLLLVGGILALTAVIVTATLLARKRKKNEQLEQNIA